MDGSEQHHNAAGKVTPTEVDQSTQNARQSSEASQDQQETRAPQVERGRDQAFETAPHADPNAESRTKDTGKTRREEEYKAEKGAENPFPDTLRGCVEGAQRNVKKAYDLLDPEMNILPEEIENAVQFLKTAKEDIEYLQELLEENSPLPEHGSIIDQIRIITDQINKYLAPPLKPSESLDKIFQKKSSPLLNALNKLDTLIPN